MQLPRVDLPDLPDWLTRLPAVSVGIAVVWLVSALVVQVGFAQHRERVEDEVHAAVRFAINNPVVRIQPRLLPAVRAVMPGFDSNEMFAFLRHAGASDGGATLQERADLLSARAFASLDSHPHRVLGLVPADVSPYGFLSHWLVHAGWLHLSVTLVIWLLAAPLLEAMWGRRVFAGAVVFLALGGAGAFVAVHHDADRALLGASAVCAGLAAAVVVRFRAEEVDFLRWLSSFTAVEFLAPAWVLGALWVLSELALWWVVPGSLPAGLDNDVGLAAHAAGALLGAGLCSAIAQLGWEERFGRATAPLAETSAARFDFARVLKLRARGENDRAFEMLRAEVTRSARHRDAVTTFWEMCAERDCVYEAVPAMHSLMGEELRRGAVEVAVAQWRELAGRAPDSFPEAPLLLKLVPAVRHVDGDEQAAIVLHQLLNPRNRGVTPAQYARAALLAVELDSELAVEAARRALAGELDTAGSAQMRELLRHLAPAQEEGEPAAPKRGDDSGEKEVAPSVFYQESDRSAFGEAGDLSALDDSFPNGAVVEAVPQALEAAGVRITTGDGEQTIAGTRVRAVAVAGVHGLAAKPVVLIDLLIDGPGTEGPLRVIRFRSDRYDPRRLAPDSSSPLKALRHVALALLRSCAARPLPDAESAACRPVRIYESLAQYEDGVLRPAARNLG